MHVALNNLWMRISLVTPGLLDGRSRFSRLFLALLFDDWLIQLPNWSFYFREFVYIALLGRSCLNPKMVTLRYLRDVRCFLGMHFFNESRLLCRKLCANGWPTRSSRSWLTVRSALRVMGDSVHDFAALLTLDVLERDSALLYCSHSCRWKILVFTHIQGWFWSVSCASPIQIWNLNERFTDGLSVWDPFFVFFVWIWSRTGLFVVRTSPVKLGSCVFDWLKTFTKQSARS